MVVVYGGRDIPRPRLSWDDLILPDSLKDDVRLNAENFILGEEMWADKYYWTFSLIHSK